MAIVPTGIPAGICTIDSSESSPLRALDCTGTPSTGSDVFDGRHARQMRRTTGARDDDLQPAITCGRRVFEQQVGRAMRGDDAHFVRNAETLEHFGGGFEGLPVGGRPHDDANERFHRGIVHSALEKPTFRRRQGPRAACGTAAGKRPAVWPLPARRGPASPAHASAAAVAGPDAAAQLGPGGGFVGDQSFAPLFEQVFAPHALTIGFTALGKRVPDRFDIDVAQDLADVHFLAQARAMARDACGRPSRRPATFPVIAALRVRRAAIRRAQRPVHAGRGPGASARFCWDRSSPSSKSSLNSCLRAIESASKSHASTRGRSPGPL